MNYFERATGPFKHQGQTEQTIKRYRSQRRYGRAVQKPRLTEKNMKEQKGGLKIIEIGLWAIGKKLSGLVSLEQLMDDVPMYLLQERSVLLHSY